MMRVAAYMGVLLSVGSVATVRAARADVTETTLELGRDLVPLADLLKERARVDINGEHVWASSSVSSAPVTEILDRYQAHCRENGAVGETWGKEPLTKNIDRSDPKGPTFQFGTFRSEKGAEGSILCFTEQAADKSASFLDRMGAFVGSKDLGKLGRVRYVYVRHERGTSHVLTMWTDEHLRIDRMSGTAADGQEPGFDNPDLPRPIRARRTVSASIDGTPYGVRGYMSQASVSEVLTAYSAEMTSRGWLTATTSDDHVRGFMKDGSLVTVGTESSKDGTVVGIAEVGNDPQMSNAR